MAFYEIRSRKLSQKIQIISVTEIRGFDLRNDADDENSSAMYDRIE